METKLIQTKDYLLLIDEEAEINNKLDYTICNSADGTKWLYQPNIFYKDITKDKDYWKVLAYYPLTKEAKELDLPLLLNPFKEIDVEALTQEKYKKHSTNDDKLSLNEQIQRKGGYIVGFKEGYKAAQFKQFSLEDMRIIFGLGAANHANGNPSFEEAIQSLSTQQLPKDFIPEYIGGGEYLAGMVGSNEIWAEYPKELKTITNSEGKQELVGTYKY